MTRHLTEDELQRRKRELRLRIGRLRRKIDGRLLAVPKHARQLLSWRNYATHFPGWVIVAALGAGIAAAAGLKSEKTSHWIGMRLLRRALRRIRQSVWNEWKRVWAESAPASPTAATRPQTSEGAVDG